MPKKIKMEKSMNELVQNIGEITEKMKDLTKQALKLYSVEVELIIREREIDTKRIHLCLDYMLDFCFDDGMLSLYKKLCRYYYNINPKATAYYVNEYREMWDSEDPDEDQN